jgi:transcriptional regulator GlxA family with amidase domain
MSLAAVKRQCVSAGFARVEHCILCIRLLAYQQLVVVEHLPVRTARLLAGFDDPSNMRRHVRRAAGRSPFVGRVLEALPANFQR